MYNGFPELLRNRVLSGNLNIVVNISVWAEDLRWAAHMNMVSDLGGTVGVPIFDFQSESNGVRPMVGFPKVVGERVGNVFGPMDLDQPEVPGMKQILHPQIFHCEVAHVA